MKHSDGATKRLRRFLFNMIGFGLFFFLSKIAWFLLQPSSLICTSLLLGTTLLWTSFERLGRRLLLFGSIAFLVLGFSSLGTWLLVPLEKRFERPELPSGTSIDGVVVLGGAFDTVASFGRGGVELNGAAERMTETVALMKKFPDATVLFSGGMTGILHAREREGDVARRFFAQMVGESDRLHIEAHARNTHENAGLSKQLLKPTPQQKWLLVTSAFHMPRAVGCFRNAGFEVIPWPVDYYTEKHPSLSRIFSSPLSGLSRVDMATREWLGLFVYWMTGRTSTILPKPAPEKQA